MLIVVAKLEVLTNLAQQEQANVLAKRDFVGGNVASLNVTKKEHILVAWLENASAKLVIVAQNVKCCHVLAKLQRNASPKVRFPQICLMAIPNDGYFS